MAASNYMTEADTESIWSTGDFDTTRFGKIGVRMAEILNFKLYKDATNQCTNTAITPILEQISEECFIELVATAKMSAVTDPWDFIQANVGSFMSRKLKQWKKEIKEMREVESKQHRVKFQDISSTFRSHSD